MGVTFPETFINQLNSNIGETETALLLAALKQRPPTSIHCNPIKLSELDFDISHKVPWTQNGIYLLDRPSFTYDPLFHAGAYYVQEAASMFIGTVLAQLPGKENWKTAIDMCAAPGGKTTQLLNHLSAHTLIIANEVVPTRLGPLRHNLIKWGHTNVVTTNLTVEKMANAGVKADLVLIDAPCSGEGMFRKDPMSIQHWSESNQQNCQKIQANLLDYAESLVKNNGYLIYSTCTYNPNENIDQIEKLVRHGVFECVEIALDPSWGVLPISKNKSLGYQCFPHKVKGEGFFFSVLRKKEKVISLQSTPRSSKKINFLSDKQKSELPEYIRAFSDLMVFTDPQTLMLSPTSNQDDLGDLIIKPLFEIGQIKGRDLIPSHHLAMVPLFKDVLPKINLSYDESINYLKKQDTLETSNIEKGWYFVSYKNMHLGLGKVIPGRFNNYLPMHWRILK